MVVVGGESVVMVVAGWWCGGGKVAIFMWLFLLWFLGLVVVAISMD